MGALILSDREVVRKVRQYLHIFIMGQNSGISDSVLILFLKKNANSFRDNKYLFAIKALIGIHSSDRMRWILSQLPSLQSK